jgi:pseudouridine-5'-phosphate glycosidase
MAVIEVSAEVRTGVEDGGAVVALETSVLAQGLPRPQNLQAADAMARAIRERGAVPAWIAVIGGRVKVGLSDQEVTSLATDGRAVKVALRDLPAAVAAGADGATTVSATLWAAAAAGIEVAATGGIGGVHPRSGDVSADLVGLSRTPGLLVCSGPKSIVDPAATLERLEELGVGVLGYRCDRLPFFLVPETDLGLEHRVDRPAEAAAAARARAELGISSTILLCNPIPAEAAMDPGEVASAVAECEAAAAREGIRGKEVTPFLLSCLAERTADASLRANLSLLEANAALAAEIAVALSRSR